MSVHRPSGARRHGLPQAPSLVSYRGKSSAEQQAVPHRGWVDLQFGLVTALARPSLRTTMPPFLSLFDNPSIFVGRGFSHDTRVWPFD
jgi:hypothetical protein